MRCAGGILLTVFGLFLLLPFVASAQVIQKWKKPDGSLYFGNKPPPGSTKIGETGFPAPARPKPPSQKEAEPEPPPGGDAFSAKASNARTRIERALKGKSARLTEIRVRIEDVKSLQPQGHPSTVATQQDVAALSRFQSRKEEMLRDLRAEQRKVYGDIADLWKQFEVLNEDVLERYGHEPDWWRSWIICAGCPSRSEAESELR